MDLFVPFGLGAFFMAIFNYSAKKWLESYLDSKLVKLRHEQMLEIQKLRVSIESALSGAVKLQNNEFDIFSEAWAKLQDALEELDRLTSLYKSAPDFSRPDDGEIDENLASLGFSDRERKRIRDAGNKSEEFSRVMGRHDLRRAKIAFGVFHKYVQRKKIFFPNEIRGSFETISESFWKSIVEFELKD